MTAPLDRRAEAAAAAVRAAVADIEPAPGTTPPSERRRWPVLAAAVVLLVAAVGGAALLQRERGENVIAGTAEDGALPRLLLDEVPAGLVPSGAGELPVPDMPTDTIRFRLYGRGDDADPVRDGDLAVVVATGSWSTNPEEGRAVQVRGVEARLVDHEASGLRSLSWDEDGVGVMTVMSRSLTDDELLAEATELRLEGDEPVVSPPAGYRLVTDLDHFPAVSVLLAIAGTGGLPPRGALVAYGAPDGERTLTVAALPDEPGLLQAIRWMGGDQARAVTVQGHDGWLVEVETGGTLGLPAVVTAWRERPGVLVNVVGTGLPEAELLAAAETVRQATDEEWDALVRRGREADGATLADGGTWRYTLDVDGGVCFEVLLGETHTGSCGAPGALEQPRFYEGAEEADEGWWVHGRTEDVVRQVAVEPEGGQRVVVETLAMTDGPGRAWAALVPRGVRSVTITALGPDGAQLDRTTLPTEVLRSGWDEQPAPIPTVLRQPGR